MAFANPSERAPEQNGSRPTAAHRKYLLITSDDFGMCHAINAGITRAMTDGVVTSTTLMAPCPWFPEAVHLAKKHRLQVGVHLCLTCDWDRMRWGPITHAPSLTGPEGYFLSSYPELVQTAKDDEVVNEFEAQIQRVRASGIEPTHIDIHMLACDDEREGVARFKDLLRHTCQKHGLVFIRDYYRDTGYVHLTDQIGSSGLSEDEIWKALEGWAKPGFYHVIGHVAAAAPELETICSEEHPARCWSAPYRLADFVFFTRPSTRDRLAELGFQLVDVPTFLICETASGEVPAVVSSKGSD
jgi:hypothetical protein